MLIRQTTDADLNDILHIHKTAFAQSGEADLIVDLVANLLRDPTAQPLLSLLACKDGQAVGHILFTAAQLTETNRPTAIFLLAPLAVIPTEQKQGIGGQLIEQGCKLLAASGVELVFVLGYPDYYTRYGFQPAIPHGLLPTYPIAAKNSNAWMIRALQVDLLGSVHGRLRCANAIDKPEYWIE